MPLVAGRMLEVGIGTGLNIPHYDKSMIGKMVGCEPPALRMHHLAFQRIKSVGLDVADGKRLPAAATL
ncbi:MAG: hypothetical protein PHQ05_06120 [Sterolibacterium sp.]|nr:hypothetical protein [Sterolibacterium sp.]